MLSVGSGAEKTLTQVDDVTRINGILEDLLNSRIDLASPHKGKRGRLKEKCLSFGPTFVERLKNVFPS